MMTDFLKDYHIINNLPYGFDFYNQGLRQIRKHGKWFFENKEQRLAELQNAYHAFCGKYLDYTPESLKGLGEFLLHAIDIEKFSSKGFEDKWDKYPQEIPDSDNMTSLRDVSLTVDAGIYWGEVMMRNHKDMAWKQNIDTIKRDIERGWMVITINPHTFAQNVNPIWITSVMVLKIADGTCTPDRLYELYNIYCEKVAPEYMPDK